MDFPVRRRPIKMQTASSGICDMLNFFNCRFIAAEAAILTKGYRGFQKVVVNASHISIPCSALK